MAGFARLARIGTIASRARNILRYTSHRDLTAISVTPQPPAAIDRPRARKRLLIYLVPGLAALLVATLFTLAFFTLAKSRDASLRDAERTTRNLVQIVEQRSTRMLQSMDMTLRSAADVVRTVLTGNVVIDLRDTQRLEVGDRFSTLLDDAVIEQYDLAERRYHDRSIALADVHVMNLKLSVPLARSEHRDEDRDNCETGDNPHQVPLKHNGYPRPPLSGARGAGAALLTRNGSRHTRRTLPGCCWREGRRAFCAP